MKHVIVFLFCCCIKSVTAQVCTSNLGNAVANVTFGSGTNASALGPPLATGVTSLQYVQTSCPSDGQYTIAAYTPGCFGNTWFMVSADHTGNAAGYFMLINASFQPSDFYVQTVTGLCAGTTYQFAAWLLNICNVGTSIKPDITFSVEKTDGAVLNSYTTGSLPIVNPGTWQQHAFYFVTPPGVSTVVLRMRNNAPGGTGNDLALDDITFRAAGPSIMLHLPGVTGNSVELCSGSTDSLHFSATYDNCYVSNTFQWQQSTDNGATWNDLPGANGSNYTRPPGSTGSFLYRLAIAQAGNIGIATCRVFSAPFTVNVILPVTTSVAITSAAGSVCTGSPVTFAAMATNGGTTPVYQWKVNGANVGTGGPAYTSSALANNDVINCMLTSSLNCTQPVGSNSITIKMNPLVATGISIAAGNNPVCSGSPVTFTATPVNGGMLPVYQWKINGADVGNNSATFTSAALAGSDKVSCTLLSSVACTVPVVSNSIAMVVNPLPSVNTGPDKVINLGGSVQLTPVVTGNIQRYTWQPPAGLDNNTIATPVAGPAVTTVYILKVVTADNCVNSDTIVVKVLIPVIIPNVFSPNGDGINDVWNISGLVYYSGCTVDVFNRYGQPVFHSAGYNMPWNGAINGKPLPVGAYYYIINPGKETGKLTGSVMVIR